MERSATKVIKRPKVIGNIEEPKANKVIKIPKVVNVDNKRERYLNPITLNYVLRPTYLAALRKIKKKNGEWQQKLKAFEEVSQEIEKRSKVVVSFNKSSQKLYRIIWNQNH